MQPHYTLPQQRDSLRSAQPTAQAAALPAAPLLWAAFVVSSSALRVAETFTDLATDKDLAPPGRLAGQRGEVSGS